MSDPTEWIAATLLPGIGSMKLARLRASGIAVQQLFGGNPPSSLPAPVLAAIEEFRRQGPLYQRASAYVEQAAAQGWRLLTLDAPDYPLLLSQIPDPPPVLWLQGRDEILTLPQLAVVGSRQASRDGIRLAYRFAHELSEGGLVMTSGLARGIDAAAHQAAVDAGCPTVAVLGTGLDQRYPRANARLADAILERGGVLVSEFVPGTGPLQHNFPRRNRVISGLSVGTLVVEAAIRSGSLITARQALEQGREVFALPGSIHNPLSKGCHALIREGAQLVESSNDILAELAPLLGVVAASLNEADGETATAAENPLLANIPYAPISFDQLAAELVLPASELQRALMRLELDGLVEIQGGYVRRIG